MCAINLPLPTKIVTQVLPPTGIRAKTNYGPDGIGAVGTLFDERGAVGSIQQSVLVRRRPV